MSRVVNIKMRRAAEKCGMRQWGFAGASRGAANYAGFSGENNLQNVVASCSPSADGAKAPSPRGTLPRTENATRRRGPKGSAAPGFCDTKE